MVARAVPRAPDGTGRGTRDRNVRPAVSPGETALRHGRISTNLLPMPHHHASENAGYELALIGVAAHAVADILCR